VTEREPYLDSLSALFHRWAGTHPFEFRELPESGSTRLYRRISAPGITAIGVYNPDVRENESFLALAKHLKIKGIPVPEVYAVNEERTAYIQEDLGDLSLFATIRMASEDISKEIALEEILVKSLQKLPEIQYFGYEGFDFKVHVPRFSIGQRDDTKRSALVH